MSIHANNNPILSHRFSWKISICGLPFGKVSEGGIMYQLLLVDDEALIRENVGENVKWEQYGYVIRCSVHRSRSICFFNSNNTSPNSSAVIGLSKYSFTP